MQVCYLYILRCSNDAFYIGYTTDLQRRWQEHCNGSAKCKYTRSFPPKEIAAFWTFAADERSEVLQLEHRLKQLSRKQKESLVEQAPFRGF